jgi:hypothetical protein
MINIVCVLRSNNSKLYNSVWVEKLKNMISRNVSVPYNFVALSDCDVPCNRIPLEDNGPGWWAKLQLFRSNIFEGPVLYFDLDTVICKNIDQLINNCISQEKFLMMKIHNRKLKQHISSSCIMYWDGDYSQIYKKYMLDQQKYHQIYSASPRLGDQAFISENVDHGFITDLVPEDWFKVTYKDDYTADLSQTRIMIFKKRKYKPTTRLDHPIVKNHWK